MRPLRVGQVWLSRDQQARYHIERVTVRRFTRCVRYRIQGRWDHLDLGEGMEDMDLDITLYQRSGSPVYHYDRVGSQNDEYDLTSLIYDPT
jgi:hypothetical protein